MKKNSYVVPVIVIIVIVIVIVVKHILERGSGVFSATFDSMSSSEFLGLWEIMELWSAWSWLQQTLANLDP
jgi:hypothetical protein